MSLLSVVHFVTPIWPLFLLTIHFDLLFLLTHGTNAQVTDPSLSLSVAFFRYTRKHLLVKAMRLSFCLAEELLTDTLRIHLKRPTCLRIYSAL